MVILWGEGETVLRHMYWGRGSSQICPWGSFLSLSKEGSDKLIDTRTTKIQRKFAVYKNLIDFKLTSLAFLPS